MPKAFAIKCTGKNDPSKLQIMQVFSSFLSVTAVKSLTAVQKSRQAPVMETRTGSLTLRKGATEKSFVWFAHYFIAHPQGTHATLNYF